MCSLGQLGPIEGKLRKSMSLYVPLLSVTVPDGKELRAAVVGGLVVPFS